jgi:hypothetical protein
MKKGTASFGLLVLLAACGRPDAAPQAEPQVPLENEARPTAPPPAAAARPLPGPPADPALADLSPSRRRAYERGIADCRADRYDPDPYPEAYRIGCAAAQGE